MESTIESRIITECQRGDWDRFRELYDEYLPKIYRYVFYRVRHKQTAEDVTASVFLKAVQGIRSFHTDDSQFSAWLYRIARNSVIDNSRRQKITLDLSELAELPADSDLNSDTDTSLKLESIKSALSQLNESQQEIVTMRVWDELSHREIAEILQISEGNSKVAFSRAVETLRQLIPLS